MQIVIETKDVCVKCIKAEYTPVEWLIANKALKLLGENQNINIEDVRRIKEMLNVEPDFKEITDANCN